VKGFSNIAKPLTWITKIDQKFISDEPQEQAFQELKARLSLAPILRWPIWRQLFQLHINWNTLGLGTMLTQFDDDGREFVVPYASESNNKMKVKYRSYEWECFTVV
jgi:hypothetical protein